MKPEQEVSGDEQLLKDAYTFLFDVEAKRSEVRGRQNGRTLG